MPKIIVFDGESETEYALADSEVTIGRVAKTCDIVIKVSEASRQHCRLKKDGSSWFVEDLGSSNGTRVNGRKVTTFELADGDEIQVGKATVRFLESDLVSAPIVADDDIELEISLEEESWLKFLSGERAGERVNLSGRLTIGRRNSNDLALTEKGISGSHVEIVANGGGWLLRDLGSTNGTLINGERVVEARLESGDRVRVGVVEFLYGEGEDVGDDLIGTVSFTEVDLDDEVFAISQQNFRKKRKSALLVTIFFLLAVIGSGAWWFTQSSSKTSTTQRVEVIAGNVLGEAGSFEPNDADAEALASESDSLEYDITTRRPHSGKGLLEVRGGGDGDHRVSFLNEIQSVSGAIRIGGFIRNAGISEGAAGLDLLWKNREGRVIGASHLNAPAGLAAWTRVEGSFRPPFGTDHAAVTVGFHDAQGSLALDDVFAVRESKSEDDLNVGNHLLTLDRSGSLTISQVGDEVFDQGGFWLLAGDQAQFLDRLFATEDAAVEAGGKSARVEGAYAAGSGLGEGKASLSITRTADGVVWSGRSSATGPLHCGLRVAIDDGVVTVAVDGARRHVGAFLREGVTQIVLSSGTRALRLSLAAPTTVQMVASRQDAVLLLPLAAGEDGAGFSIPIQLDFSAETNEATELMASAQNADGVQQQSGRAMALYEEILNRFSFRKDLTDRAVERIAALSQQAETALAKLGQETDDVVFFRTFIADRSRLGDELARQARAYAGSAYEPQFKAVLDRLNEAADAASLERRKAEALVQLARGRDLMTPGRSAPVLARGFFESVILLAPDSELAGEAGEELKKIETILGR